MSDNELADALNYFEAKRAKKEAFELLALVNPHGLELAQYAAQDLKGYKNLICRAAEEYREIVYPKKQNDTGKLRPAADVLNLIPISAKV